MDREGLRATQAPLKDRYRADPQAALVTLATDGAFGDGVCCTVQTGRAVVAAGLRGTLVTVNSWRADP